MTHRDEIRASRNELFRAARDQGVDMEPERAKDNDQRKMAFEAGKLINDQAPRHTREQLQLDDPPPVGTFDGANDTFGLSAKVKGHASNIRVIWHDSANNTAWSLTYTSSNTPGNHSFFFDPSDPQTIIVGNPPLVSDRLILVYLVER